MLQDYNNKFLACSKQRHFQRLIKSQFDDGYNFSNKFPEAEKETRVQKFARTNNGLVAFLNMRQELELQPTGEIKEHKASASTPNATGAFSGKSAEYVSRGDLQTHMENLCSSVAHLPPGAWGLLL